MADSTYKDSDNTTFSATTGQKLDPNTLMKKRMFEALARTMVKPEELVPKPVSKDPVNVQAKKAKPEYLYGVKKAKQKIEREISECGLFLKEKSDFEEKPEQKTEASEQKQSNYPSTWNWAKPKQESEFKEPEPVFKEPELPAKKKKKPESYPIREEATGPLPLSSYKPKKAKAPYRGSKDLPSKSQVDAEQAGEESWKDRYIQSKKVQKVVKESGLINKAKKSFKSKNAPETSATPEVNVFPGKDFCKTFCFGYKYLGSFSLVSVSVRIAVRHLKPIYTTLFLHRIKDQNKKQ
jgi:hypothetical protein